MKKTFDGNLFNRIEKFGNKELNHVGCEGKDEKFGDFLIQFVPSIGMRRKVTFTVESQEEPEIIEGYKTAKEYIEKEAFSAKNEENTEKEHEK